MSSPSSPPPLAGVHHLKLPATSIDKTHDFYVSILGFHPLPLLTHKRPDGSAYAVLAKSPGAGGLTVEIRHSPEQASLQRGWDPITWAVSTLAELEAWVSWLNEKKIDNSGVLKGVVGWLVAARDPDGRFVRFYTLEQHEWDDNPDWNEEWLGKKE